jgi:hypothetical protein
MGLKQLLEFEHHYPLFLLLGLSSINTVSSCFLCLGNASFNSLPAGIVVTFPDPLFSVLAIFISCTPQIPSSSSQYGVCVICVKCMAVTSFFCTFI